MTENAISDCLNVLDSTRTLCLRIHELKQHSRDADDQNPEQIKRQLMSKLLILREANRKSYEQLVQAKTITAEHKSELDNARIRLQALQYKKLHLKTIIKNYEEKEYVKVPYLFFFFFQISKVFVHFFLTILIDIYTQRYHSSQKKNF